MVIERIKRLFAHGELNLLLATVGGGALCLWLFLDYLKVVIFSLLVAFLLDGAVSFLQRLGLGRGLASVVVVIGGLAGAGMLLALIPYITLRVRELLLLLPEIRPQISGALAKINEWLPEELETGIALPDLLTPLLEGAQGWLGAPLALLGDVVTLAVYSILAPLLIFFMLRDKPTLLAWCARWLPSSPGLTQLADAVKSDFGLYIRGKCIEAALIMSTTWIAFLFFGLNFAFVLSVLVGLSVFVPFVGALVVTLPVVALALLQFGWSSEFAGVIVAYTVLQVIDAQILVPMLFSEVVKLHPIAIFVAILFFGGLWGVWGVFFAIPLAAFLKSILIIIDQQTGKAKESTPESA